MKKFIILLCVVTAFFSCEEDIIRPLVNGDGSAPGTVESVVVNNTNGGAILTYNLPNDSDLLYVEAEFKRQDDAEVSRVRSSIFNNSLEINGFGEEKDFDVNIYAVDEGENRSEPVTTIVSPEKAPLQFVSESLEAFPDFGGMVIVWDNPLLADISVEISALDEFGVPQLIDVAYSAGQEGSIAVRGFDSVETTFIIIVKDRYGNIAPTKTYTITPLFEEAADKANYAVVRQPHDAADFHNNWRLPLIFNGNTVVRTRQAYLSLGSYLDIDPLPEYAGINAHMFTLDLGVELKMSRMLMHVAAYASSTPRFFDVWGTNQLNPEGSFDGWEKIIDLGETVKPSGLPFGENTQEDIDTAARGLDIIADATAPSVRYIRFVNRETWGGVPAIQISEVEFFGKIID